MNIDMRHLRIAKYVNTDGVESYTNAASAGRAMKGSLDLDYDESGRIFSDSEPTGDGKLVNGGKVQIGAHRLTKQVVAMIGGHTFTPAGTGENPAPAEMVVKEDDAPAEVGFGFTYVEKDELKAKHFFAVFLPRVIFTDPKQEFETKGKTTSPKTPTLDGELLPAEGRVFIRITEHANHAAALTHIETKLGYTA